MDVLLLLVLPHKNSIEVTCVQPVEKSTLLNQLDTLFADFGIDALKNWNVIK